MENITTIKTRRNGQWVKETNSYIRDENSWKKKNNLYANGEWHMPDCKYSKIKLVIGDLNVNFPLEYGFIKETSNTLFIDWGDGSSEQTTLTGDLYVTHIYNTKGEYTVKSWVDEGNYAINFIGMDIYYTNLPDPTHPGESGFYIGTDYYDIRDVFLGLGVNYILDYGFGNLKNLFQIRMLEVERIGDYCFAQTNLTEIAFGNKLKIIGDTAFDSDSHFKSITIPITIDTCWSTLYADEYICKGIIPPLAPFGLWDKCKSIKVPAESVEIYKAAPNWAKYADKITAI